jgi:hypothetical protein
MSKDRMFRVIVLGGLNLVACGGAVTSIPDASTDGGPDGLAVDPPVPCNYCPDAFPAETATVPLDASWIVDPNPDGGLADAPFLLVDGPTGVIFPPSDAEASDVVDAGPRFFGEAP